MNCRITYDLQARQPRIDSAVRIAELGKMFRYERRACSGSAPSRGMSSTTLTYSAADQIKQEITP